MLQVLDDNVKRGSRVFESNHVRTAAPAPGLAQYSAYACTNLGTSSDCMHHLLLLRRELPHTLHVYKGVLQGFQPCGPVAGVSEPYFRLTCAQVLILGWCDSQRDLEVVQKVVSQLCHAYEAEGGRVIVVMTQRAKLELEALFRRILPPPQRFGSQLVFRQARRPARQAGPALLLAGLWV